MRKTPKRKIVLGMDLFLVAPIDGNVILFPNLSVSYQRQARRLIAALMLQYIPTQSLGAKDSVLTNCANVNFSSSRQVNDK